MTLDARVKAIDQASRNAFCRLKAVDWRDASIGEALLAPSFQTSISR